MEIHNLTDEQRKNILKYASTTAYENIRREIASVKLEKPTDHIKVRELADTPVYRGACLSVVFILHLAFRTFNIDSKILKTKAIITNNKGAEYLIQHGYDSWFEKQLREKHINLKEMTGGDYIYTVGLGIPQDGVAELHSALGFSDHSLMDVTIQQMERPQHLLHIDPFWVKNIKQLPANVIDYTVLHKIPYNKYKIAIRESKKMATLIEKTCIGLSEIIGRPYSPFELKNY